MPVSQKTNNPATTGDIFIRDDTSRAFFTETVTITNVGPLPVNVVPGTPMQATNIDCPNTLVTMTKMVYLPATLLPGVPTKVCVINAGTVVGLYPGGFVGLRINTTKVPLTQRGWTTGQNNRASTQAQWEARLNTLLIAWFNESTRFDPAQT